MTENIRCDHVLLAEDDALLAETLHDFLTQKGFRVSVAADGQEALELAAQAPITAVVTDLRMPRLDGKALVRRLRRSRPALPVVVMTGYAPLDWRTSLTLQGEGPLILLDKPVRLDQLLGALEQVLGGTSPD